MATSFDKNLVHILQKIRKQIAEEKNIPPFIVFQDPSLEDMATQYPINMEELRNIIGVGKGKAEKYGSAFITAIKQYVDDNNIERAQDFIKQCKELSPEAVRGMKLSINDIVMDSVNNQSLNSRIKITLESQYLERQLKFIKEKNS